MMTDDQIKNITDNCYMSHKDEIESQNLSHLKKVKKAIFVRVTLPVTILIALGIFVLRTINTIGIEAARYQASTTEKVDAMSFNLMNETKLRREGDFEQQGYYDKLEKKMDENFKYLYQNSIFKTRGDVPYIANSGN